MSHDSTVTPRSTVAPRSRTAMPTHDPFPVVVMAAAAEQSSSGIRTRENIWTHIWTHVLRYTLAAPSLKLFGELLCTSLLQLLDLSLVSDHDALQLLKQLYFTHEYRRAACCSRAMWEAAKAVTSATDFEFHLVPVGHPWALIDSVSRSCRTDLTEALGPDSASRFLRLFSSNQRRAHSDQSQLP